MLTQVTTSETPTCITSKCLGVKIDTPLKGPIKAREGLFSVLLAAFTDLLN